MTFRTFAALILLSASALAVEPKAVVKPVAQVEPGDITILDGTDSTGDAFRWIPLSGKPGIPSESGRSLYFASGKPGEYRFELVVGGSTGDGKVKLDSTTVVVKVVGAPPAPAPTPGPAPSPGPAPKPIPTTGHLYVTYLADGSKLLPSHAAMKVAPKIRAAFTNMDASWSWHQNDEAEPKEKRLLEHVDKFPSVLIQGPDGKVLAVLAAPSEDDVIAKVREIREAK